MILEYVYDVLEQLISNIYYIIFVGIRNESQDRN